MGSPIVTTAGLDVAPETGQSQDAPGERGSRRARAVRISTVLAGLLHLAMAAVLAGIPGSSPTLDRVPVPEGYTTAPPAALSARPAASPVLPTPDTAAPTALPVSGATPADGRGRTPPGGVPTGTVRPTPGRGAPVAVGATARGSKTAARPGESATRPGTTAAPAKTTPAKGPTPAKTTPAKAASAKTSPGKPSDTPAEARPTPPGPTGEPPGRAGGPEGNPAGTDIPPGQAKK
ncbi:hypothetical protein [Nonomuraea sp. 10N515B]|uniref:hypothetical protein n=1 Tax=Nonomuraea sp. 10N515B TaxID=3457422 RepID=UPI003FCCD04F